MYKDGLNSYYIFVPINVIFISRVQCKGHGMQMGKWDKVPCFVYSSASCVLCAVPENESPTCPSLYLKCLLAWSYVLLLETLKQEVNSLCYCLCNVLHVTEKKYITIEGKSGTSEVLKHITVAITA